MSPPRTSSDYMPTYDSGRRMQLRDWQRRSEDGMYLDMDDDADGDNDVGNGGTNVGYLGTNVGYVGTNVGYRGHLKVADVSQVVMPLDADDDVHLDMDDDPDMDVDADGDLDEGQTDGH